MRKARLDRGRRLAEVVVVFGGAASAQCTCFVRHAQRTPGNVAGARLASTTAALRAMVRERKVAST